MWVVEEGIDLGLSTSYQLVQAERTNVACTCRPKIAAACLPSKISGTTMYHSRLQLTNQLLMPSGDVLETCFAGFGLWEKLVS